MNIENQSLSCRSFLVYNLQAAMFNFTEITFMLMDAGANVSAKNSQGDKIVVNVIMQSQSYLCNVVSNVGNCYGVLKSLSRYVGETISCLLLSWEGIQSTMPLSIVQEVLTERRDYRREPCRLCSNYLELQNATAD